MSSVLDAVHTRVLYGKFKDGWENRYKLRCSQVLFAYVSYTYTPVWCRINEREENLLIVCTRECTCETYKRVCPSDSRYISSINECGWFYFFFHHTYTGKNFLIIGPSIQKTYSFHCEHTHTYVFGYAGFTTKIIEELCVNSVFNGVISSHIPKYICYTI